MREPFCMGMEEHMVQGVEREGKKKRKEEEKRGRKVQEISANSPHVPYTRISSSAAHQHNYAMKDDRGYY